MNIIIDSFLYKISLEFKFQQKKCQTRNNNNSLIFLKQHRKNKKRKKLFNKKYLNHNPLLILNLQRKYVNLFNNYYHLNKLEKESIKFLNKSLRVKLKSLFLLLIVIRFKLLWLYLLYANKKIFSIVLYLQKQF